MLKIYLSILFVLFLIIIALTLQVIENPQFSIRSRIVDPFDATQLKLEDIKCLLQARGVYYYDHQDEVAFLRKLVFTTGPVTEQERLRAEKFCSQSFHEELVDDCKSESSRPWCPLTIDSTEFYKKMRKQINIDEERKIWLAYFYYDSSDILSDKLVLSSPKKQQIPQMNKWSQLLATLEYFTIRTLFVSCKWDSEICNSLNVRKKHWVLFTLNSDNRGNPKWCQTRFPYRIEFDLDKCSFIAFVFKERKRTEPLILYYWVVSILGFRNREFASYSTLKDRSFSAVLKSGRTQTQEFCAVSQNLQFSASLFQN